MFCVTPSKRGNPKSSRVVTAKQGEGGAFPPGDLNEMKDRYTDDGVIVARKNRGWNGGYCLFCSNPRDW